MFDILDKLDKLSRLYDSSIRLSGVVIATAIVAVLLLLVLFDNREVSINGRVYFEQLLPKNVRDGIIISTVVYLVGLYLYIKKKSSRPAEVIIALCPVCKVRMVILGNGYRCPDCGGTFGY